MHIDKLSVKLRIVLGFAIPIILFVGFAMFLTQSLMTIKSQTEVVKNESLVYALLAKEMELDVTQVQQFLTDVSATRAKDGLNDGWKEADAHFNNFMAGLDKFQKYYQGKSDKTQLYALASIKTRGQQFYEQGKKLAAAYVEGGSDQGNPMMPERRIWRNKYMHSSLTIPNSWKAHSHHG
ncbi:hypothetical protein [Undibacterium sp. Ren11W]|uniref:hypothetical protein n=1 Tax=Undibacterium sp. Ren11W TaxID=3413045 RepID=UPI003BF2A428